MGRLMRGEGTGTFGGRTIRLPRRSIRGKRPSYEITGSNQKQGDFGLDMDDDASNYYAYNNLGLWRRYQVHRDGEEKIRI